MKNKKMMRENITWYYRYEDYKYIIAKEKEKKDMYFFSCKYTAIDGTDSFINALLYTVFHKNEVVIIKNF